MNLDTFFEKANPDHPATFKWVNVQSSVGESITHRVQYGALLVLMAYSFWAFKIKLFFSTQRKQAEKKLTRERLPAGGSQGNQKEVF